MATILATTRVAIRTSFRPYTPGALLRTRLSSGCAAPKTLPSFSLEGKVCLVTGGARGLGYEFCRAFADSGCTSLAIIDLQSTEAKQAADELAAYAIASGLGKAEDFNFIGIECDVSSEFSVQQAYAKVMDTFGKVDSVVASAGIVENYTAFDYPSDRVKRLYDINVHGAFYTAREAARNMIHQGSGSIVLVSSMSANIVNIPQPQTPYNASKAAVKHMAASLAVEWAKTGIRVNSLSPGYMLTKLTRTILENDPDLKKTWESLTPMGRMGEPEDLAGAIVFLASDASNFMTGSEIRVDGGYCSGTPKTFEFTKRKRWADLLVTELADGINLILSATCTILYCAPAMTEITGWKSVDLLDCDFLELIATPDDQTNFRTSFDASLHDNSPLLSYTRINCSDELPSYPYTPRDMIFEVQGEPHSTEAEGDLFFITMKPFPSRNTESLDTYVDIKTVNDRLQSKHAELSKRLPQKPTASPLTVAPIQIYATSPIHPPYNSSSQPGIDVFSSYHPPSGSGLTGFDALLGTTFDSSPFTGAPAPQPNSSPFGDDENEDGSRRKKLKKMTIGEQYGSEWAASDTLTEHDKLITSIDWAPQSNRIVTASQDRNAYVWQETEDPETGKLVWKPTLVLLRINRAATHVRWSPKEDKFAVASGARAIAICSFDEENNWWVSKLLKKPIRSTVLSVDWHPNNVLLASGSADMKARVFSAYIKEVDARPAATVWGSKLPFNTVCGEYSSPAGGWVHAVAFSPSGDVLAFASHDSSVNIVYPTGPVLSIRISSLPFVTLAWTAENSLVAAGHDCQPVVFSGSEAGWQNVGSLDAATGPKLADGSRGAGYGGNTSVGRLKTGAFATFRDADTRGQSSIAGSGSVSTDTQLLTVHQNTITSIRPYQGHPGQVSKLSTTGVDGKLVIWDTNALASR
ncbi:hypothetical protein DXG01_000354 [Tephrocybe rancida]|nr:hypothetical protein DXG01_000354 [Tephrocybe rancida]